MNFRFQDKAVFVTGAGIGIGYAICLAYAQQGAVVGLNDIDVVLAQKAANQINEQVQANRVIPYPADVANTPALQSAIDDFSKKQKRLDIVIANAGVTVFEDFLEMTPDSFEKLTNVNLKGSYFTAQAATKNMIRFSTKAGKIILMSSVTGVGNFPDATVYGMTKAGIRHLTQTMALRLSEYGIAVNAVAPGAVITERTLQEMDDYEGYWRNIIPTNTVNTVKDIVETVLFLTSDVARQINGQTIVVDGAWTLRNVF